jgi:hypothetical protein
VPQTLADFQDAGAILHQVSRKGMTQSVRIESRILPTSVSARFKSKPFFTCNYTKSLFAVR